MTIEQKQGVLILSVAILLLAITLVVAERRNLYGPTTVIDFPGISIDNCGSSENPFDTSLGLDGELKQVCNFKRQAYSFSISLPFALTVLLPLLLYGLLRSLGILKPLFSAERHLSKLIPDRKE